MLNSFFQAICRVGIFMICAQAIMQFKAKESYEKYLKLLVSTMILIQLFLPVGNLLAEKTGLQVEDVMEQFKREVEQEMRTAKDNAAAADAILEQMTLEEIRNYMDQLIDESGSEEEEKERGESRNGEKENQEGRWEHGDEEREDQEGEEDNSSQNEIEIEEIEPISIGTVTSGE